ncbi:MAG: type IV secretion system protein [Selenomonadaceae bacterium]|nr:type IV secretion system protein [Selenomonadaceae bacterium]
MKNIDKKTLITKICLGILLYLILSDSVFAADAATSESVINKGTGINAAFDKTLQTLALGFIQVIKVVVVIMTAVAAIMVGIGIEDGKRAIWNWLLGAGLAINFGAFMVESGFYDYATKSITNSAVTAVTMYTPEIKSELKDVDILSAFMNNYLNGIIIPGSKAILPSCMKLMIIVTIIEASWELAFKLVSGDKIKYLLSMMIKCGFFMFLMYNWIEYMGALANGFQQIGFTAGGTNLVAGLDLKPDSIWANAFVMWNAWYKEVSAWDGLGTFLVSLIGAMGMLIVSILTAFEMFMARIEFYTMALLTIPLLPFAVTSKFGFLADKAIGAMINLSIKLSVISFLTAIAVPMMKNVSDKAQAAEGFGESVEMILQACLVSILLYMLVKKIPDLVAGLLNGQPALSGTNMMDTVKTAAKMGMEAGKALASGGSSLAGTAAGVAAGALAGAKSGGISGALKNLGKSGVRGALDAVSPVTKRVGAAAGFVKEKSSRQFKRYNGSQSLTQMVKDPGGLEKAAEPMKKLNEAVQALNKQKK